MERLHLTWARSRQVFGQRRLDASRAASSAEIPEDVPGERAAALFRRPRRPGDAPPRRAPRGGGRGAASARAPPGAPAERDAARGAGAPPALRRRDRAAREGAGDDLKLTVSFPGVGAKRLVARFAGLEAV